MIGIRSDIKKIRYAVNEFAHKVERDKGLYRK